jgi:hypothetical protein
MLHASTDEEGKSAEDIPGVEIVPASGTLPYYGCNPIDRFCGRRMADPVHEPLNQIV